MTFNQTSQWTEPVIAQFMILLDVHPKLAYAEIAWRLNKVCGTTLTKNSCIGYARRHGFEKRQPPRDYSGRKPRILSRVPKLRLAPSLRSAPPPPPQPKPKQLGKMSLLDLGATDCRWPEGNDAPFLFCGAPILPGCPYCLPHAQRAFPAVARQA